MKINNKYFFCISKVVLLTVLNISSTWAQNQSTQQGPIKTADFSKTLYCQNQAMSDIQTYTYSNGLIADRIVVQKSIKKLFLMKSGLIIKSFEIAMGPSYYDGPKAKSGDNKTPEGLYFIDYKKVQSSYYEALHVSYPNEADLEFVGETSESDFFAAPSKAGGQILIHGFPKKKLSEDLDPQILSEIHPAVDWTQGCIAVTNSEMLEINSHISFGKALPKSQNLSLKNE